MLVEVKGRGMALRIGDVSNWIYMCLVAIVSTMAVAAQPYVYVANGGSASYSTINVPSSAVSQSPFLGGALGGVAVTPDGSTVYTTLAYANSVTAVSTSSNTLLATIGVGA